MPPVGAAVSSAVQDLLSPLHLITFQYHLHIIDILLDDLRLHCASRLEDSSVLLTCLLYMGRARTLRLELVS